MRSIDVLQVVTSTDRRGAETIAVELGPALVSRGLETETVALTAGAAENGFELPVLGTGAISWSTLVALRARAKTRVVVAHGSRTLPACALALVGTRVPFVYRNIGDPGQWATTPLQRLRTGAFLHRARAIVALTDRAAAEIHRKHRIATGPSPMHLVVAELRTSRQCASTVGLNDAGRPFLASTTTRRIGSALLGFWWRRGSAP